MSRQRRGGRPRKDEGMDVHLTLRVRRRDYARAFDAARRQDKRPSAWMRDALLRALDEDEGNERRSRDRRRA